MRTNLTRCRRGPLPLAAGGGRGHVLGQRRVRDRVAVLPHLLGGLRPAHGQRGQEPAQLHRLHRCGQVSKLHCTLHALYQRWRAHVQLAGGRGQITLELRCTSFR